MDRRKLILQAGATALAVGAGAYAQPVPKPGPEIPDGGRIKPVILKRLCRIRPDIASLTSAQLTALQTGVQTMMARPASDPTSWSYQAAMHATFTTPTLPLWNGCQHGTIQFLGWHRLFLYYFERILRKASGSSSLMLPYWNWTAARAMPAPFTDSTPGNSLFTTHRGPGINGGSLLPTSAVAIATPMADIPFNDFTGDLEGTPHGAVHVACGGWMGSVPTAAQDPIFWLHHCNIDRLWEGWIAKGGGRANPTTPSWLSQTYSFFDETGTQRTVPVSKGLNTCRGLGYRYPPPLKLVALPWLLIAQLSDLRAAEIQAPPSALSARAELGARAAELKLPLPPGPHVYLAFDDISVDDPEGYYEIYINPPAGKPPVPDDPSYAGNLVLFGLSEKERAVHKMTEGMAMGRPRRVFDITRKLPQLRAVKGFDPAAVRIVLVLRTTEGARLEDGVRARIGKVQLIAK
jgi:hypothetical protein